MPKLEYSERFAEDLAKVTLAKVEAQILTDFDNIEHFGEFGSRIIPQSIKDEFGEGVRKVAVNPFDIIYTFYPDRDLVRIEALIHQRTVV